MTKIRNNRPVPLIETEEDARKYVAAKRKKIIRRGRAERLKTVGLKYGTGSKHQLMSAFRCQAIANSTGMRCRKLVPVLDREAGIICCQSHQRGGKGPSMLVREERIRRGELRGWLSSRMRCRRPMALDTRRDYFRQIEEDRQALPVQARRSYNGYLHELLQEAEPFLRGRSAEWAQTVQIIVSLWLVDWLAEPRQTWPELKAKILTEIELVGPAKRKTGSSYDNRGKYLAERQQRHEERQRKLREHDLPPDT